MPQLRSGKVVGAETLLALWGVEVECELGKQVVVELSPQLVPEREPEQPSPSYSQPAALSGGSSEQLTFLLSVQKEQAKSRHRTLSSIPSYKFSMDSGFYPMQKHFLSLSMDSS